MSNPVDDSKMLIVKMNVKLMEDNKQKSSSRIFNLDTNNAYMEGVKKQRSY